MAEVELKKIGKKYDTGSYVIENLNLTIKDKEFVVLVGPSGCGKSTTLRMIAGLEDITDGELLIDGKVVNNVHPKDRDIAMVFQNYALYPHMSVAENMSFALKIQKKDKKEIQTRVNEVAEILDLAKVLNKKPKELSGGQRQRVALGRAIVRKPKVFLFDEPLSNLDAKLRVQMRAEILKIQRSLQATTVYVTHDQTEAMTMGDRIVVMKDGVINQVDTPMNLYDNPYNKFVGSFIGSPSMNFIDGKVSRNGGLKFTSKDETLTFLLPEFYSKMFNKEENKEITLGIRPEHINDKQKNPNSAVKINLMADIVEPLGNITYVHGNIAGSKIVAITESGRFITIGNEAELFMNLENLHFFEKDSGIRLLQ